MYDKRIGEASLDVQVPLFVPSAWFLYGMHARGEEIGELVTEYTRQMICLKVASLYFGRLELDEGEVALASRVAAAEALEHDMRALGDEGLLPDWQVAQAETFHHAGRIGLDGLRRSRRQVESELLALMGLAPWARLNLAKEAPLADIDGSLEEAVTQALLANPRLHIADRKIEIARSRINLAVAEFLPNIVGFGSLTHTDDSFQRYSTNVLFGLSGVISLFNGFRSVNEYKAARAGEQKAFIAREEETLAVVLQVIRAHLTLQTARDRSALADRALDVAESRLREAEAREAEGLVNFSERLSILSDRDAAVEEAAAARFRKQVSIATMMNVLGQRTFDNNQEDKDDE